jgi:hypothetical protein
MMYCRSFSKFCPNYGTCWEKGAACSWKDAGKNYDIRPVASTDDEGKPSTVYESIILTLDIKVLLL